jgi:hypothetical protein
MTDKCTPNSDFHSSPGGAGPDPATDLSVSPCLPTQNWPEPIGGAVWLIARSRGRLLFWNR